MATLDGAQMCKWITFDDSLKPTLNHHQLAEWIHNLAEAKLDTSGSERTYTRRMASKSPSAAAPVAGSATRHPSPR